MCARMRHFALSAIGRDRPGIVAAVTEVLLAHAVNIEDSHATILRGHFTMMLVVAAPEDAELERLRADLAAVRERLELEALAVSELAEIDPHAEPPPSHIVTLYGRDLLETMRSFPRCVGIAAPQIDELVRVVVVDVTDHPKATACHGELVLVNPRVVASSGAEVAREGCLSIPDLTANVRRATHAVIEARTPDGGP